ncbi:MAG TPA: efflux RND transporter periplasmic adaptor subunit [Candidatus Angelobacter sp.]|jgi:HlyD family secretion protein|nr:efflux RND transporter periplasmic adaptor subunit [Candidatus Angelobacter sp.]
MMRNNTGNFWRRNRLVLGAAIALAALLIFSSGMMRKGVVPVRAESVIRQPIASVISTNGKVEPVRNFEAHAPAPATVKHVFVKPGDQVKAGQLLVQLDDADARASAARALAQLRAAEADLHAVQSGGTQEEVLTLRSELGKAQAERDAAQRNLQTVQRLQQNGAAAPAEVDEARQRLTKAEGEIQLLQSKLSKRFSTPEIEKVQAAVAQARAAYSATQDLLRNSNIHAPFAGTVYQIPVKNGSYVNAGELLIQVANLEVVQVRAFVDEPEIGRLAKNQRVEITWDAVPGRLWEGIVTQTPTVVTNLGTRTVGEITCQIANTDKKLLPNVNVNVTIVTARHDDALTVSREAVHDLDGKRMVYEIVNNKIKPVEVKTGISSLTRVEILSGVSEGTRIAPGSTNAQPLRDGTEVKVVER